MTQKIKPLIFDTTGAVEGNVLAILAGVPRWTSGGAQWGNITGSILDQVDLKAALAAREALLPIGATGQYLRGDKTWQTLDRISVGLSAVDNTSDADKPVSRAVAAALAAPRPISSIDGLTDALEKVGGTPFTKSLFAAIDSPAFVAALGLGSAALQNSTDFAAKNHTHTIASSAQDGFMSSLDKIKLLGIQTGATANSTDAQLRDRSTHTGSQSQSTILGLDSALLGKVNSAQFSTLGFGLGAALDAIAARSILGLGSAATYSSTAFAPAIHAHSITDITGLSAQLALLATRTSPYLTGSVSLSGTLASTGEITVGGNRVYHEGDAIPAATLGGISAAGFAPVNHTHAEFTQLNTALASKEPLLVPGTTSQYLRGDKTWQALDRSSVGLSAVDNTSDLLKPVSTAVQAILDTKASLSNPIFIGTPRVGISKIFHEGNDGPGSGLDADTLRGKTDADFASANHTHPYAPISHTHAIADITGLMALLDSKATKTSTGNILLGSDPLSGMEAATKQYVDQAVQGLGTKQSVVCATASPIATTGLQTLDGVAVKVGNRVLVKAQSDPARNGIYVVQNGVWGRASDLDSWDEVNGSFVFVERGTVLGGTGWVASGAPDGTLGSTAITWTQFSGAGTYTGSHGITKTGSDFALSVMPARTLKGNLSATDADPVDVPLGQLSQELPIFTSTQRGQVPASNGASGYLRSDGLWVAIETSWGSINGPLSRQADLSSALASKAPLVAPTFQDGIALSSGNLQLPVAGNHQIGNLLIQNGGSNSPLIKSLLDNPAIIFGSPIRLQSDFANRITAPSGVSSHMSFETGRAGQTGFKWFTAPLVNDTLVEQMFLSPLGLLGIGINPTERLDVAGNIKASGTVFASGYQVWTRGDAVDASTLLGQSPNAFAPAQHGHEIADINGLRAELDAKGTANSNHTHTMDQIIGLQDALDIREPRLPSGTTAQYLRGDKTFQPLNKAAVGLSAVDNTSDANKPLSTAAVSALAQKLNLTGGELTGDLFISEAAPILMLRDTDATGNDLNGYIGFTNAAGARKAFVGYANGSFEISTQIGDLILTPQGSVRIGNAIVYHSGNLNKGSIGLSAVDNTSDVDKPISQAVQTALLGKLSTAHEGAGGTVHALATTSLAGFMSSTDKTKLNGIAASATANSTDAQLRDRATHTGQQPTSTIVGLDTALTSRVSKGLFTDSGLTISQPALIGRSSLGSGSPEEITLAVGFTFQSGKLSYAIPDGQYGDVAITGSNWSISTGSISNAKLASMPQGTFKARQGNAAGSPQDLTGDQATALLSLFTGSLRGLVPPSGGGTTTYLRADGSWVSPPNTGIWGQITGSLSAQSDLVAILSAKQNLSGNLTALANLSGAADRLAYFDTANSLALAPLTAFGRSLVGATNSSSAKTALGLDRIDNTPDSAKPISTAQQSALDLKIGITEKGVSIATLDSSGKIPNSQLPPLAINDTFVVGSQSAQLALTAQNGDIAVRTDLQKTYVRNNGTSGTMSDWTELLSSGQVSSVNGRTGAVNLSRSDVGLPNVDNTSDADKPLSVAQAQALADHISSPTAHPVATPDRNGFMSSTDKSKLDALQNRANQTGLQNFDTISLPQQTLLGRSLTGTGAGEALTVGTGLQLSNGVLAISGSSFSPISTTGTGSSQVIPLPQSGLSTNDLLVIVEGLVQSPADFTITSSNLTITAPTGANIVVRKPSGATGPSGANPIQTAKRASDGSLTSQTLASDDQLTILLDSNSTYEIRGMLFFDASVGGYQTTFLAPTGTSGFTDTAGDFFAVRSRSSSGLAIEKISGVIMTDSTSGNLVVRWAQASQNSQPTKLKRGSHVILTKLN